MKSSNLLKFLQIRLKNQLGLSKLNTTSASIKFHSRITLIGYIIVFALLVIYFAYLPFQMLSEGNLQDINTYVIGIIFWILAIWTCLSGILNLIYSEDHDYIFTLPIEKWQAKLSVIIYQYILYSFLTLILLSVVQISLILINPIPFYNIIYIFLMALCTPALAIVLTVIVVFIVKEILNYLSIKSNLVVSLLSFVLLIAPLIFSYSKTGVRNPKLGVIEVSLLPFPIFGELDIIQHFTIFGMIAFVFLGSYIFLLLVNNKYDKILAKFSRQSDSANSHFKLYITPSFVALMKRELKLYSSSFPYLSNTILMPILLILIGAASLLFGEKLIPEYTFSIFNNDFNISSEKVYYIIFTACLVLTTTTTCAFSIEGSKIWIIKSLPLTIFEVSFIKFFLNLLIFIPGIIIAILSCLFMGLVPLQVIQAIALLVCNLIFTSVLGLLLNFRFPNYQWSNEMEVVKQGLSTIIAAITSMLQVAVTSLIVIFLDFNYLFILIGFEMLLTVYFIITFQRERYFR